MKFKNLNVSDLEGLQELKQKADAFTALIFDWVAPLEQHQLLGQMYEFNAQIDSAINKVLSQ